MPLLHDKYAPVGSFHDENKKMGGVSRVALFCLFTFITPAFLIIFPLYLKFTVFAPVNYYLAESDVVEIKDGINTIFCQSHHLQMNSSFNAFQLASIPEMSKSNRKHIRLKKSMTLPDDTLEYWGFFLLKGATVELRTCSRHEGSRILVVKGEKNLKTCGLLDHNKNKANTHFAKDQGQVIVTFETAAEEIDSKNRNTTESATTMGVDEDGGNGGEVIDDSDVSPRRPKVLPSFQHDNDLSSHSRTLDEENEIPSSPSPHQEPTHRIRHHHGEKTQRDFDPHSRLRRDLVLDRGINHGGNAINYTEKPSDSVSSFENSLLTCYDGQILLAQYFPPSNECHNVKFLENSTRQGSKMVTRHEVVSNGYYYYIFYSDNDLVKNDIHVIFDIYKPTFEYSNISESKGCVNSTNCTFPINMMSEDLVIVEVPTRDGIEHEDDDITQLVSTCIPRTEIYAIFPILVLLLILSCAFL